MIFATVWKTLGIITGHWNVCDNHFYDELQHAQSREEGILKICCKCVCCNVSNLTVNDRHFIHNHMTPIYS